ncbi:isoleucine--tRNA ligase [Solirubrobacter ginsenosidimutans]|uniref:Isoleucine--tRNA ligase n=1 Tax=Solirubrobacter ginsenosidimutans TaxID=490573 RepID=A0A9X3N209_9ACTN|nr:isoleucine--tRNA ligase [Solirubrobacter ginsenosidimutans]MDA0165560.1 isoleucine--tRNA ligase [Solirubrobacter ginsenosidimutans]
MPHRPLPKDANFPQLEEQILERWRERDIYNESMRRREGAEPFVFYEGPPTANGRPGSHHVLARVFKDIFPRYKTMQGFYSYRKGGWDCHGLPVEIAVQNQLGIENKQQIEDYGIAEFNAKCRESVFEFLEDWTKLTERIGYWVDLDEPYRTLDTTYVESVWWALKQLWDRDLLYEGFKVVPYCPKDGTSLSSHEVSQGYKDVEDPSVYVKYPVTKPAGALREGDVLLVWTTTPWTLVSNAAVAVDPELTYMRSSEGYVLAEALAARVLGDGAVVTDRFPGAEMVGAAYEPPFGFIPASDYGEKGHTVLPADFVSAEDGTGIVHTAIAFGEDDFRLGAENGLNVINPVRSDGTYDERIGPYEGVFVKHADNDLIKDLEARGRMFRSERLLHAYPHCWRCGTPLLYYAKPTWYIRMSAVKDRLLAANETVDWHPEHIKHGRFGRWLENNVDWALGRERYWGTPLPIWRNEAGESLAVGSFEELKALSGVALEDPHRPFVDDVTIPSPTGGEPLRRVPEVIDVWFDSGSMPFAQWHAPFENQDKFDQQFPADYICEGIDQTRGWFYSLIAISTLLFDQSSYKTVLCLGHLSDPDGKKMSKSLGNVVAPWDVIERHGADAFRWYFLASKLPWDGYSFDADTVGESLRSFLLQLWNTYGFYVMYANVNGVEPADVAPANDLDRWALSRLAATVETVTERLDAFDATRAGQAIAAFVDDLSNWYVRRSRRRFWDGDAAAFSTLRKCLVTVSQLLAPFTPFVADEIYDNLDGGEPSVHLTDWPAAGERDTDLEFAMATVRETVRLGLAARGQAKLKVRQPLRAAVVVAAGGERAAIERLAGVALEELNVKELRYVTQADELGSYEVKPNYRALGPRFGKAMPQVAAAVASLDPQHVADALRDGGRVGISIDGHDHELDTDDLMLAMKPLDGYQLEREGSHAVALELELDESLRREGLAREIVHAIQNARKGAGLEVEDRISLALGGASELLEAAQAFEEYVTRETLALSVSYDGVGAVEPVKIEGLDLHIAVSRAG